MFSPKVHELKTVEEHDKLVSETPLWYLLGYSKDTDSDTQTMMDVFKTISMRFQDELVFGVTTNKQVLAKYKKGGKVIVDGVKKPFIAKVNGTEAPVFLNVSMGKLMEMLDQKQRIDSVAAWVQDQKFPFVSDLSGRTFGGLSHGGRFLCAAIYKTQEEKNHFFDGFLKLARSGLSAAEGSEAAAYRRFYFGVMDGTEDKVDEFLKGFGVDTANGLPAVVVFDMNTRGSEKYYNEDVTTLEELPDFLAGILDGNVTGQIEGFWGMPDRTWRTMKSFMPFLSALDFLPQYSLVAPIPLFMLYLFFKVLCSDDDYEDDYDAVYDEKTGSYVSRSEDAASKATVRSEAEGKKEK